MHLRWLYPASSEPPAQLAESADEEQVLASDWSVPVQPPPFIPASWEPVFPPILNDDVPWFGNSWTLITKSYFIEAIFGTVEIEEVLEFVHLDNEWRMPQFPQRNWRPPDEPSYYSTDQEEPHPEVDRVDLPIWVPWRPIPQPEDFFSDEAENVMPDFYESPHRFDVPIRPKPWIELVFEPMDDEPLPEIGYDFIPPMDLPPPVKPYFMPDFPSYFNQEVRPDKCPPPCLRRPEKRC